MYSKKPTDFWSGYESNGITISLRIVEDLGLTVAQVETDTGDWRVLADRICAQIYEKQQALAAGTRSVALVAAAPAEKQTLGVIQTIYKISVFDSKDGREVSGGV